MPLPFFSVHSHSRGFGQSNSLPTAGSVGGGMGRRNPRQYQIPSRNVPSARLGLLGTSGFVSSTQRNTAATPTIMKPGRQVGSAPGTRVDRPAQRQRLQDVSPDDPKARGENKEGQTERQLSLSSAVPSVLCTGYLGDRSRPGLHLASGGLLRMLLGPL